MYDHFTHELDSTVVKLPDALQQPRIVDMVVGQYALVSLGQIWVNEHDEVRIDGTADVETEESKAPYDHHVYAIMLNQGIVIDMLEEEQEKPIKFDRTPVSRLMDDEDFDLSHMLDVVWIVNTEHEQDRLCEIYKEQTGKELYDVPFDFDNNDNLVVVSEPVKLPGAKEVDVAPDSKQTKRRLFGRKDKKQSGQQVSEADEVSLSIDNYK